MAPSKNMRAVAPKRGAGTRRAEPDPRRSIPSVDALLRSPAGVKAAKEFGRAVLKLALAETIAEVRAAAAGARRGRTAEQFLPDADAILARAVERAAHDIHGLDEVINATGVVLHTGLGRAPLAREAAKAATRASTGYADLEIDRETGRRGKRTTRAERLLRALTGAEDAIAVNNNAGALLLTLAALARRKEVLVSRGELIEIGGEFRLPDVMTASGAKLVEVGTTNRTRLSDYRQAITPRTALILKVHPSNYRIQGFTDAAPLADLAALAARAEIPLAHDVGSGLLDRYPGVPKDEPSVIESLRAGAGLVAFSGDKLLGGPQAGIVAGRAVVIERLRRNPVARTVRMDKMNVAALEATLRLYATGRREEIPIWRMLGQPRRRILERARSIAANFDGATAGGTDAAFGGGALPGHALPSAGFRIPVSEPEAVAERLRRGRPPVFCRTEQRHVAFDLRTVPPEDDERLARAIRYALEQG
jgi:L-seryl-tRNA(Ser) seleniumtransferase